MKKILMFLADGFEEIEALAVVDILRRAEVQCDLCSLSDEFVTGSHGVAVKADIHLDTIDARDYDGVVLPGGPGTDNLKNNVRVVEFVKDFYKNGKLTAAICAAPSVLAEAGIVDGHKITSYPSVREKLNNSIYIEDIVVQDGNILTSRGAGTAMAFGYAILDYLGLNEEAAALREGMMYEFLITKTREI